MASSYWNLMMRSYSDAMVKRSDLYNKATVGAKKKS